ncbi:hypothetical protein Hanom_Chr04g00337761 [Helianthus anomalus]
MLGSGSVESWPSWLSRGSESFSVLSCSGLSYVQVSGSDSVLVRVMVLLSCQIWVCGFVTVRASVQQVQDFDLVRGGSGLSNVGSDYMFGKRVKVRVKAGKSWLESQLSQQFGSGLGLRVRLGSGTIDSVKPSRLGQSQPVNSVDPVNSVNSVDVSAREEW